MALNLLCILRIHAWGEWQYEAHNDCKQVRMCRRDGVKHPSVRTQHEWSDWQYQAPNSCIQARVCNPDGKSEEREEHEWSDWQYQAPNSCIQARVCNRDGKSEEREEHAWGDWVNSMISNTSKRTCGRCAEVGYESSEYSGDECDCIPPKYGYCPHGKTYGGGGGDAL